ncbi:hypothetical protein LTR85_007908 [Meristemomyces frigidus]|nr:hypothetical protein LTR85_007908 [Meristemomyces frigidus]
MDNLRQQTNLLLAKVQSLKKLNEGLGKQQKQSRDQDQSNATSRKGKLKGGPRREYHDLLNATIQDARGESSEVLEPLAPSQIGASYWTSAEKDAFFSNLARCGPGDLRALSHTEGSKSEAEFCVYLRLLQEGAVEVAANLPPHSTSACADVPAVFEVGVECETHLNFAADALSRKLNNRDVEAEKNKYGEGEWLIDEAYATELEQQVEQFEAAGREGFQQDDNGEMSSSTDDPVEPVPFDSAALLRPEAFLQLSRNLFMNGTALSQQETWHGLVAGADSDSVEPAIFRTAFDDLHNVVVSLTRRLVQATIFQATSRLRASDFARANRQPKAEVREMDVVAALDVLGMRTDRIAYWARLPRRCGIDVYTDSEKYRQGRPGMKNGVKLTYAEIESELGLSSVTKHDRPPDEDDRSIHDEGLDESDIDSNMMTLARGTDDYDSETAASGLRGRDPDTGASSGLGSVHTKDDPGSEDDQQNDTKTTQKRKRALSPRSFARAEDRYLEALDQQAGRAEERRLWAEVLGREPSEFGRSDRMGSPVPPVPKRSCLEEVRYWRDKVKYEGEWERLPESVPAAAFAEMEESGRRGRNRRAVLRDRLLNGQSGSLGLGSDDEGDDSSD